MKPFISYKPLQDYYLEVAHKYSGPDKVVLKTDLFNEAIGAPKKGGIIGNVQSKEIVGIDINDQTVDAAKAVVGNKAQRGDIRTIPWTNKFDLILDFSTLDHVCDPENALCHYYQALKQTGTCILLVWVTRVGTFPYGTPNPNEVQYFFNKDELGQKISQLFTISEEFPVYVGEGPQPPRDWLHQYVLIK